MKYLKLCTNEYDVQLKQIENINWLPWVGCDYPSAEKKLLAFGLSYAGGDPLKSKKYAKPGEPTDCTREWDAQGIQDFEDGKSPHGRWRVPQNMATMLLGRGIVSAEDYRAIPSPEIVGLWRRMVRTNFVQNFHEGNSGDDLTRNRDVMNAMCEILKPTHIVMFAKAHTNLSTWDYVQKHKPAILQTANPGDRGMSSFTPHIGTYKKTLDSWGIYPSR